MKHNGCVIKIELKYCGGCNPEIDRVNVVKCLNTVMHQKHIQLEYVKDSKTPNLFLLINGCAHACKEEELKETPVTANYLSVQGERVELKPVPENQIPAVLSEKIVRLCSSLRTSISTT